MSFLSLQGPSPEWLMFHPFTPADLFNLSAEIIETHGTCLLNITWTIAADASIRFLNATKICVMTLGNPICIRCDYTEEFPNHPSGMTKLSWQFHYVGFPVEEDTDYFIDAFNLPPANPNSDDPQKTIELNSPSCEHNVLKYCGTCVEKGKYKFNTDSILLVMIKYCILKSV
uniref:Interleukin 17 receptor B n=1 Tax=Salvator merianae TaxID=96440 RepID=A0A8D0E6V0_SALMN